MTLGTVEDNANLANTTLVNSGGNPGFGLTEIITFNTHLGGTAATYVAALQGKYGL